MERGVYQVSELVTTAAGGSRHMADTLGDLLCIIPVLDADDVVDVPSQEL